MFNFCVVSYAVQPEWSMALQTKIQASSVTAETMLTGSTDKIDKVGTVNDRNSAGCRAETTKAFGLFLGVGFHPWPIAI